MQSPELFFCSRYLRRRGVAAEKNLLFQTRCGATRNKTTKKEQKIQKEKEKIPPSFSTIKAFVKAVNCSVGNKHGEHFERKLHSRTAFEGPYMRCAHTRIILS